MNKAIRVIPPGYRLIFVRWYRHPKTGEIIHASRYGKKAFPLIVPA